LDSPLDSYLSTLSSDVESSGVFTISEEKAREKLARFALLHPSLYLLELVSYAVASGATRFQVKVAAHENVVRFDGQTLSAEDVRQAVEQVYEGSSSRRLRMLGVALGAAQGWAGKPVILTLSDGRFQYSGETIEALDPIEKPALAPKSTKARAEATEVVVRKPVSRGEAPDEAEHLALARYAPLKLHLNGKRLSRDWQIPSRAVSLLVVEHPDLPLPWEGTEPATSVRVRSGGGYSAALVLLPPALAQENPLLLLHLGCSYTVSEPSLSSCLSGIVRCDDLNRNLSCSEIVKDRQYEELLAHLQENAQTLIQASVQGDYRFANGMLELAPAVEWARDACPSHDQQEKLGLNAWLELFNALRNHPHQLDFYFQEIYRTRDDQNRIRGVSLVYLEHALAMVGKTLGRLTPTATELVALFQTQLPQLRQILTERAVSSPRWDELVRQVDLLDPWNAMAGKEIQHPAVRRISCPQGWDWPGEEAVALFRPRAEMLLAAHREQESLDVLLETLGVPGRLAEVLRLPKVRQADLTALDLVADILEYRRDPMAVPVRTWVAFLTEDRLMRQFRYDDAVRVARAQGSVFSFLRLQATAAATTFFGSPAQASYWTLLRKTFGDCLTGRQLMPKNPDPVLLPMLGVLFEQPVLFSYLVGRLAHRTRLTGDWQHAEMIVARGLVLDVLRRQGPFVIATKLP
jgi:hypothetical protein